MSAENEQAPEPQGLTCAWCGEVFRPGDGESSPRPVCRRCLRLLRDAGLKDEEIFAEGKREAGEGE